LSSLDFSSRLKPSLQCFKPFICCQFILNVSELREPKQNKVLIESLRKPRRQRQRDLHQTKSLMSRTIAVHVRYKSLYISLPSSAQQQGA